MNPTDPVAVRPDVLRVLQSKDEIRAFYNKLSKVYDLLAERSEEPVRTAGLEQLGARSGETLLEIGCGTGHCLVTLAKAVGMTGRVFGIDLSDGMLHQAVRHLAAEGLDKRVGLHQGDAAHLPFDRRCMDAVFMSFTLELFDTPEVPRVLRECQRVLRPNGRIVVVGMSKERPNDPLVHVFEWTHRHFPNFLDCRPIYVRRALEAAGFSIQSARLMHMWVPVEIVLATPA